MKRKLSKLVLFTALPVISMTAYGERTFADIYTDCGLGAMIAPNSDAVAAVTNVTWDLGTTAVSSNISSPDTCVGGQQATAAFIYQSYDSLAADLAQGKGKYLDALAAMVGFSEEDRSVFASVLREEFATIVSEEGYSKLTRYEKAEKLYNLVYMENA